MGLMNPHQEAWVQPLQLHMDYWTPDNRQATFPRVTVGQDYNYQYSDKWLLDGRYIRLKQVQFGYSLPARLLTRVRLSGLRIFVMGQDLFTISRLGPVGAVLDPEAPYRTNFAYPSSSTAALGLNLTL